MPARQAEHVPEVASVAKREVQWRLQRGVCSRNATSPETYGSGFTSLIGEKKICRRKTADRESRQTPARTGIVAGEVGSVGLRSGRSAVPPEHAADSLGDRTAGIDEGDAGWRGGTQSLGEQREVGTGENHPIGLLRRRTVEEGGQDAGDL